MSEQAKRYIIIILCSINLYYAVGYNLNDRYCFNGEKPVDNCMHSQSGLCSPTKQSQPCIGNTAWEAKTGRGDASSCSLDYLTGEECSRADWPIFAYDAQLPPFRLTVYRHHTWMTDPSLALNLSLATDVPTGVKFFFEHQHDPQRRLCRKFSIVNPDGYFVEEYDEDDFYGLLDNLPEEPTHSPEDFEPTPGQKVKAVFKDEKQSSVFINELIANNDSNNTIDDEIPSLVSNLSVSDASNISLSDTEVANFQSSTENISSSSVISNETFYDPTRTIMSSTSKSTSGGASPVHPTEPLTVPSTYALNSSNGSSNSSSKLSRKKRHLLPLPPVLFWDCPMFADGLEGQDFFLRLSDDAGWGAHLSFTVPTLDRHDHVRTPVSEWWVFHYVHLEHVTLESSIPVTVQAAPFARLMYNVSLRTVCCTDPQGESERAASDKAQSTTQNPVGQKFAGQKSTRKSGETSRDGCVLCGEALASIVLAAKDEAERLAPPAGTLLSADLPYQAAGGEYAVTVEVLASQCPASGCFVAVSPVFSVAGSSYGDFVLVVGVVVLVVFLLSFVVMALVIRSQAEIASKKLWCRPRVLLVCSPHSPPSLSLITTLTSFLHHSAAVSVTTMHSHLADADPYLWVQYEMRTANKVLFLVPPKGQTVARCSPVQQQWRLGVLCYAAAHGALAPAGGQPEETSPPSRSCCRLGRRVGTHQRDKDKFALLTTSCSGPVPPEISHLQRFWLLEDIVYLVTWIHDGSLLDRLCLWGPLMRRSETSSSAAGTPYRRRSKKNSFLWSGCRRDRDVECPAIGDHEVKSGNDVGAQNGCNGRPAMHARNNVCMTNNGVQAQKNPDEIEEGEAGEGAHKFARKNETKSNKQPGTDGTEQPDGNTSSGTQNALPNVEFSSSAHHGTTRSQSVDSSSLNSSLCLRIEETAAGNVDQVSNSAPGQERPDWVDDILNDTEANASWLEERASLPVTQSPCAPSLVHLKEAVRLVEKEQAKLMKHRASKVVQASKVVKPSSASKSWLQRLFFRKKKSHHSSSKPILEDTEELSLYDNSVASNSGMSKLEAHQWQNGAPDCGHHSNNFAGPESPSKLSANTLCDLSNEEVFSVSYDGVRLTSPNRELSDADPGSYDGMPSVSELPLLGEALMSPATEASCCQVEEDDDDFTAMLFGGTVSE